MNNLNFFTNRILAGLVTFPHLVRDLIFFLCPAPKPSVFRDVSGFSCCCSVALSHRRPGRGQPGDGALELSLTDTDLAQAGVVHGGRRGDGQRGGQACVGGAPQELGGQTSRYGARGRA